MFSHSPRTLYIKKVVFAFQTIFIIALSGCRGYSFVSLNVNDPGEFTERISHFSNKVTDLSISGKLNNQDEQTLIELATNSDLLTRIDLSNCDVKLSNHAFAGCIYLKSIALPLTSMSSIPHHLFSGCSSLMQIEIPENYKSIGEYAFSNCTSLKEISLPSSLETIGNNAFNECTSIKEIRCASPVPPNCTSYCFNEIADSCRLIVPRGSATLYKRAIGWEKFKTIDEVRKVNNKTTQWDNY